MKLLIVGDLHFKIARQTMNLSILKWIEEVVIAVRPDIVVYLGDACDNHAILRSEILSELQNHFKTITQTTEAIYVLGNHDMFRPRDNAYHAFQTFNIPNLTIVDKPTILHDMSFVPFMVADFPSITTEICFAHQTFTGADYGELRADDGVDPSTVDAEIIISGHIHKRQFVDKVIYPGSPVAYDANDIDQDKGLMLFDSDTYKYEFIESPFPNWYRATYNTNDNTVDEILQQFNEKLNPKDNYILELEGYKADVNYLVESKKFQEYKSKYKIRVIPTYLDKKKETVSLKSFTVNDIVSEYIDKVYKGTIDKVTLKDRLTTIIEE